MIPTVTSLCLAVLLLGALDVQDWNGWRGPSRSGSTTEFSPPAEWPEKPSTVWQVPVGVGHASPVVADGRVFVLSRVGEQEEASAFDVRSGKQLWQSRYDAPYDMNPAARAHGKGPKSTPIVSGNRLFTLGISGILSAFDAASGRVLWRRQFTEFDAAAPEFGTSMSPAFHDGLLIVHVGGEERGALAALDPATGNPRWRWTGEGPAYASPVVATFGPTAQVITHSRSHLISVHAATGELLWRLPFTTPYDQNIVTPAIVGDMVVYSGYDEPLAAVRVSRSGGKWSVDPVWQNAALPLYMSSPVLSGGHLYGLSHRNKGQFFCVDARTGETRWTTRGREGENAAIVAAGGVLLAATTEGELVVFRENPARFDVVRRYRIADSPVWTHPVPAGSGILIKAAETLSYWTFN